MQTNDNNSIVKGYKRKYGTKHGQLTVSHTDKCLKPNPYYERRETAKYIIGHKIKWSLPKKIIFKYNSMLIN